MPALILGDLIKLEVSLDEVLKTSRVLLKNTKDRQVRSAMKTMFDEIKKADKAFVKGVLVPLFGLRKKKQFDKEFPQIHKRFKTMLITKRRLLLRINCGKVTNKIQALKKSQAWKKPIPVMNRSLARLEVAGAGWIFNDSLLWQADQDLMGAINDFMDAIASRRSSDPNQAFVELKAALKPIEKSYMRVQNLMAELEVLGDAL